MRMIVTGSRGMLGTDLMHILAEQHEVLGCDLHNCNILEAGQFEQFVAAYRPAVVIHAAAYTNVDQAETDKAAAMQLNETGTQYVAAAAKQHQAKLVYISTDYVFDGTKTIPYTEADLPHPLGVYGESKWRGEQQVQRICGTQEYLIVRIAWLYGQHGKNFVSTILQLARQQHVLRVVNDQTGSPTYTKDVVRGIMALLERKSFGIMHLTNEGSCTWHEFAETILAWAGIADVTVQPITSAELHRPAPRPKFSVFALAKFAAITGQRPRHWKQGLQEYFEELGIKN